MDTADTGIVHLQGYCTYRDIVHTRILNIQGYCTYRVLYIQGTVHAEILYIQ